MPPPAFSSVSLTHSTEEKSEACKVTQPVSGEVGFQTSGTFLLFLCWGLILVLGQDGCLLCPHVSEPLCFPSPPTHTVSTG